MTLNSHIPDPVPPTITAVAWVFKATALILRLAAAAERAPFLPLATLSINYWQDLQCGGGGGAYHFSPLTPSRRLSITTWPPSEE